MLDAFKQARSLSATIGYDPIGDEGRPTAAQAMVPMLDWPTDLFNAFTAKVDDAFE